MSKKKTGLLIAISAAVGAAAGISYYLKYKSFNDELDKDFHDYEDEDSSSDETEAEDVTGPDTAGRTYITLDSGKCKSNECKETPEQEEKPSAAVTVEEDTDGAEA